MHGLSCNPANIPVSLSSPHVSLAWPQQAEDSRDHFASWGEDHQRPLQERNPQSCNSVFGIPHFFQRRSGFGGLLAFCTGVNIPTVLPRGPDQSSGMVKQSRVNDFLLKSCRTICVACCSAHFQYSY